MTAVNILSLGRIKDWFLRSKSANELMELYAQDQNERAFHALYDMYADKLYYFLLVLSSADTAADICQKTWIKVIEKKHQYRDKNNFQAWLYTLARHTLIDEFRKQNRLTYDSELVENVEQLSNGYTNLIGDESKSEQSDKVELFHNCIQRLPFKQREALSLQLDGFSLKDIAVICHSTPETIKTRLRYARCALKLAMETTNET